MFSTPNLLYKPKIRIKLSCFDIKTHVGTLKIPRFYPQNTHVKWDGETNVRSVFGTLNLLYKHKIRIKLTYFDIKTCVGTLKIPIVYPQDTHFRSYGQSNDRFMFSTPNLLYKLKIRIKLTCSDIKTLMGILNIPLFCPQNTHQVVW